MRKIAFYLSLLVTCLLVAQPGYRGRKLSVQYRPSFNFHGRSAVIDNNDIFLILPTAVYHGGYLEYVVGRKVTLGAQFSRCGNRINMHGDIDRAYNTKEYLAIGKLIDNELEFVVKRFKNKPGNLAPFGTYFQLSFSKHWYKLTSEKYDQVLTANNDTYSIGVAIGKQRVFRDVIVFDLSAQLSASFASSSPMENSGRMAPYAIKYIRSQNFFGFNFGIGYLAPKFKK